MVRVGKTEWADSEMVVYSKVLVALAMILCPMHLTHLRAVWCLSIIVLCQCIAQTDHLSQTHIPLPCSKNSN